MNQTCKFKLCNTDSAFTSISLHNGQSTSAIEFLISSITLRSTFSDATQRDSIYDSKILASERAEERERERERERRKERGRERDFQRSGRQESRAAGPLLTAVSLILPDPPTPSVPHLDQRTPAASPASFPLASSGFYPGPTRR